MQVTWNLPFPKPVWGGSHGPGGVCLGYPIVPADLFEDLVKSGPLSWEEPFSKFKIAKGKRSQLTVDKQVAPGGVSLPTNNGAGTAPVDCNIVFHVTVTLVRT